MKLNKLDDNGQVSFYVLLIVIFFVSIFLLYLLSSDVGYKIAVNQSEFQRGENIVLSYDINNGRVFDDVSNVKFAYAIDKTGEYDLEYTTIEIGSISARATASDIAVIKTYGLDEGEYRIWTFIEYWIGGKLERSYLSLDVTVSD